jgi:hypothetical protein
MWVRGIDLREVTLIEEGAEGVRITFDNGERKFVSEADGGFEILEGWRLAERMDWLVSIHRRIVSTDDGERK